VGGFCVFSAGRDVRDFLERLQAAAPHRLLFCSDLEDGAGQQIEGETVHPPAAALTPDAAETAGIRTAVEARRHGITMTFAPVCDVVSNPRNPIIGMRAFPDPLACPPRFVAGARSMGLRTCAKHFPGHGATSLDSHSDLPVVDADEATWRARDLPPFAACIEAGVDAVMTAHLACPALTGRPDLPATLSRAVLTDLLRGEMGFEGLVVTDALLMEGVLKGRTEPEAARLALEAGCDVLLCPRDVEGVLAVAESEAPKASLDRIARAAEPLPDRLAAAAGASLTSRGAVLVGPGSHPAWICDLHGRGTGLARGLGTAFRRLDLEGKILEEGPGPGFGGPVLVVARGDRAWGGPVSVPGPIRDLARKAELVVVCGPEALLEDLAPEAWIRVPGEDPASLESVRRRLLGGPGAPRS
jgi:hypothetical protein